MKILGRSVIQDRRCGEYEVKTQFDKLLESCSA